MPSNQSPLGARPARFRRERVLIVGCGDVGLRLNALLQGRLRVMALTSSPIRTQALRAMGITPLVGDLDQPATLQRLSGIATRVVHLAPPPGQGWRDPRTLALVRVLMRRTPPLSLVYGSTSGVYGNCQGDWIDETRRLHPETPRATRRVDAEAHIRWFGRASGLRTAILRIPGIYAPDRDGGTPRARLLKAVPVLRVQDDVYTNHIHADDLARACQLALWRGAAQRAYNVNDATSLKMGDYFDAVADLYGLPRPPRISLAQAQQQLSPMLLSFMQESRRMQNVRMQRELRLQLRYPDVVTGLQARP
ncbi:MAG: SDR family oxidoreductase [Rhodoferax sp.]|nr:SDR family oxidoreductase [Rhodoferax sp.]MCF8208647.1 SDR family oxidoreductase [Rhodoferax sp.]